MSVAITASQNPKKQGSGTILHEVFDLVAVTVKQLQFCSSVINGYVTSQPFDFDLNKLERNYHLTEDTVDYCKNVGTEPTEAILTYLSNIKNVTLDPSPLNFKKAKKFLNFVEPIEDRYISKFALPTQPWYNGTHKHVQMQTDMHTHTHTHEKTPKMT